MAMVNISVRPMARISGLQPKQLIFGDEYSRVKQSSKLFWDEATSTLTVTGTVNMGTQVISAAYYGSTTGSQDVIVGSTTGSPKGMIKLGASGTCVVVDEVNDRLGIGAVPTHTLDVIKDTTGLLVGRVCNTNAAGAARILSNSNVATVNMTAYGSTSLSTFYGASVASGSTVMQPEGAGTMCIGTVNVAAELRFGTANALAVVIDTAQKVGIGGTPYHKLDVVGSTVAAVVSRVWNSHADGGAKVIVNSDTATGHFTAYGSNSTNSVFGETILGGSSLTQNDGPGTMAIGTLATGGALKFGTAGTLAVTIDTSQNITLGGSKTVYGGSDANGTVLFSATSHATKTTSKIAFGSLTTGLVYDEPNARLCVGAAPSTYDFAINKTVSAGSVTSIIVNNANYGRATHTLWCGDTNPGQIVFESRGKDYVGTGQFAEAFASGGVLHAASIGDFVVGTSGAGKFKIGQNNLVKISIYEDSVLYTEATTRERHFLGLRGALELDFATAATAVTGSSMRLIPTDNASYVASNQYSNLGVKKYVRDGYYTFMGMNNWTGDVWFSTSAYGTANSTITGESVTLTLRQNGDILLGGSKIVYGGTNDNGTILFSATSSSTKTTSKIAFGSLTTGLIYDEPNARLGLGAVPGSYVMYIKGADTMLDRRETTGDAGRWVSQFVAGTTNPGEIDIQPRGASYVSTGSFGETFASGGIVASVNNGNFGVGTLGSGALKLGANNTIRTIYAGNSSRIRNFISTDTWELDYAGASSALTGSAVRVYTNSNGSGIGWNTYYDGATKYTRTGCAQNMTVAMTTAGGLTAGDIRFTIYPSGTADTATASSVNVLTLRATGDVTLGGSKTVYGGIDESGTLLLVATEHATKTTSKIAFGSLTTGLVYDEPNARLGVGAVNAISNSRYYAYIDVGANAECFYGRNVHAGGAARFVSYSENAQTVFATFGSSYAVSVLNVDVKNGSALYQVNGAGPMVIGTGVSTALHLGTANSIRILVGSDGKIDLRGNTLHGDYVTGGVLTLKGTTHSTPGAVNIGTRLGLQKSATVTAGSTVTFGDGNLIPITGTTTINYATTTGWATGTPVCLYFDGATTITHNAGSVPSNTAAFFFQNGANFTTAANTALEFYYDGTYWRNV